jgi:hypothetical protein
MTNVAAINFKKELAEAESVAAQRRAAADLSAEDILASLKRELRSVSDPVFGTVYYYPLSVSEYFAFRSKVDADDSMTALNMAKSIVEFARNKDGSLKFKPEHATALLDAPPAAVYKLASTLIGFNLAAVEKK